MIKHLIRTAITLAFSGFALLSSAQSRSFGPGLDTLCFRMTLPTPSLKALDLLPQTVTAIAKRDGNYDIDLRIINPYLDAERNRYVKETPYDASRIYERSVGRYLQSTALIDAADERISAIADTLFAGCTLTYDIIIKSLAFCHDYITYDEALAREIDAGTCRTLEVSSILDGHRGTCSEYANLFTALMRHMNIPTRFAVGYAYGPRFGVEGGTHAWPECYIEGAGWFAVDPSINSFGFPHHIIIKMRHGLDFEDCDIRTLGQDIEPLQIEIIE
jgi:Transglutaminase-like enzymes, putative cysteine proteases